MPEGLLPDLYSDLDPLEPSFVSDIPEGEPLTLHRHTAHPFLQQSGSHKACHQAPEDMQSSAPAHKVSNCAMFSR